jgi:hypothetical protein
MLVSLNAVRFFYLYPRAPQQSGDVPAVEGFLCDNAAVLGAVIKKPKRYISM